VTSLRDFERFIRLLAARSGQLLNKTELAKDVGVSIRAIDDWLAVLEASGQIVFLEPWFGNFGKRIVKSPKVYFRDSGLLCSLLGLDESSLARSPFLGAVWEGFVFAEFRKLAGPAQNRGKFWFYRDQAGNEIDLLYEQGGRLHLIETKWTEFPEQKDAAMLAKIRKLIIGSGAAETPGLGQIVCRTAAEFSITTGIQALNPGQINLSRYDLVD
jgi:predicted AAA+ superfamily ATPase